MPRPLENGLKWHVHASRVIGKMIEEEEASKSTRKFLDKLWRAYQEVGERRFKEVRLRDVRDYGIRQAEKFAARWAPKCAPQLRSFCYNALRRLALYFSPASIDRILREAQGRGLSIEVVIILASQYNPIYYDDGPIKEYLETGKVDLNQLASILISQGIRLSPNDLKAIIEGTEKRRGIRFSWLPRRI